VRLLDTIINHPTTPYVLGGLLVLVAVMFILSLLISPIRDDGGL
jgi:hypothetical protein